MNRIRTAEMEIATETFYGKDLRVCEVSVSVTYLVPVFRPLSECHLAKEVHLCVHLMIGKGQIAHKRAYWDENELKRKNQGSIVTFCKLSDPVPMLLQVVNASSN